jgi:hypothetical protein
MSKYPLMLWIRNSWKMPHDEVCASVTEFPHFLIMISVAEALNQTKR